MCHASVAEKERKEDLQKKTKENSWMLRFITLWTLSLDCNCKYYAGCGTQNWLSFLLQGLNWSLLMLLVIIAKIRSI